MFASYHESSTVSVLSFALGGSRLVAQNRLLAVEAVELLSVATSGANRAALAPIVRRYSSTYGLSAFMRWISTGSAPLGRRRSHASAQVGIESNHRETSRGYAGSRIVMHTYRVPRGGRHRRRLTLPWQQLWASVDSGEEEPKQAAPSSSGQAPSGTRLQGRTARSALSSLLSRAPAERLKRIAAQLRQQARSRSVKSADTTGSQLL